MSKREKSDKHKSSGDHPGKDAKIRPPKGRDDDELSIEELEEAAGGTAGDPPPDPNAAC